MKRRGWTGLKYNWNKRPICNGQRTSRMEDAGIGSHGTQRAVFFEKENTAHLANKYFTIVFWFWGFCTVCEVNLLKTFRKQLWHPSSMVMSQNANERRVGVLPYTGVDRAHLRSNSWPVKMGTTAVSETSSANPPRTPCKNPKNKKTIFFTRWKSKIKSTYLAIREVW